MKQILRLASLLVALAWSHFAFGYGQASTHNADFEKIKTQLNENPNLAFSKDTNGWTLLHWAAFERREDTAKLLVDHGAEIDAKTKNSVTPLQNAALVGDESIAELLVARKAKVNSKDSAGNTPLHLAAMNGNVDVAKLLLANHAEINATNNSGQTPLHYAAFESQIAIVQLLLTNKAEVNPKDYQGATPLHMVMISVTNASFFAKDNPKLAPLLEHPKDIAKLLRQHGGHE